MDLCGFACFSASALVFSFALSKKCKAAKRPPCKGQQITLPVLVLLRSTAKNTVTTMSSQAREKNTEELVSSDDDYDERVLKSNPFSHISIQVTI